MQDVVELGSDQHCAIGPSGELTKDSLLVDWDSNVFYPTTSEREAVEVRLPRVAHHSDFSVRNRPRIGRERGDHGRTFAQE